MASGGDSDNDLTCRICLQEYTEPKKLPNCGHSFCKSCLISYISKEIDKNETENEFQCPLCRSINNGPSVKDALAEWIQNLENSAERVPKLEDHCESCKTLAKDSKADYFCLDCQESLCKICSDIRHTLKSLQLHKVVAVGPNEKQSAQKSNDLKMTPDYLKCRLHSDRLIEFYCKDDETLCCAICRDLNHKNCTGVVEVKERATQENAEAEIKKLKEAIISISAYAETIIKARASNIITHKKQVKCVIPQIQDIRKNIDQIMNALEINANETAESLANAYKASAYKEKHELRAEMMSFTNWSSAIDKAVESGSLIKMNVVAHLISEELKQSEAFVFDMSEKFERTRIELRQGEMLQAVLNVGINNVEKLATVNETKCKNELSAYVGRSLLRNCRATKIAGKILGVDSQCTISSLLYFHTDKIVIVDSLCRCIVTNQNFEVLKICDLSSFISDRGTSCNMHTITRLANSNLVVSVPSAKKLLFLSVGNDMTIIESKTTTYTPKSIYGLKNGDLAIAWDCPVAFGIVSVRDALIAKVYFCTDKAGRQFKTFEHMAVDEIRSHVIQPCTYYRTVYCFDFDGNPKFSYQKDYRFTPYGVALDGDSNIYIGIDCTNYSYPSVHVISPTGSGLYILTLQFAPSMIAFKKNGKEFAVTRSSCDTKIITLFELQEQ